MRILLDTHVLLWALSEPERLDEHARATIHSVGNQVLFSAVTFGKLR